ncbi:hypothetical protein BV22DRAFT_1029982 [Leucogyrophana mollusca]|uniref:Uncharacterized protein n=1 Tax=Leucogyrophana mollusca TaxID=85980 RepID=A0ACB8BSQ4_9AGAM|nr:hypothetical protein BV22DRAFT_1029982 [Leucogyrophana mollusca]
MSGSASVPHPRDFLASASAQLSDSITTTSSQRSYAGSAVASTHSAVPTIYRVSSPASSSTRRKAQLWKGVGILSTPSPMPIVLHVARTNSCPFCFTYNFSPSSRASATLPPSSPRTGSSAYRRPTLARHHRLTRMVTGLRGESRVGYGSAGDASEVNAARARGTSHSTYIYLPPKRRLFDDHMKQAYPPPVPSSQLPLSQIHWDALPHALVADPARGAQGCRDAGEAGSRRYLRG